MGQNSTKVQVKRDVASPSGDGKSCITGPLDRVVNYDDLWDQLVELLKDPLKVQGVQEQSIAQVSETEFTITKALNRKEFDAKTIHNLGLHRMLLDEAMLVKWTAKDTCFTEKYKIDKASGRICAERLGPINELVERSYTILHRDPLRVEFYIEVPGFRRCGQVIMAAVRHKLLDPAMKRVFQDGYMWHMFKGRGEHKDFLKAECESICQPGQYSVVSDTLDDIADFETLWAATVDVLRYPDGKLESSDDDGVFEVKEVDQISATEFHVRKVVNEEHPKAATLKPWMTWDKVMLDKPKGTIVADTFNLNNVLQVKTWYVINTNPVRVECWCEGPPARKAGTLVKMRLLQMIDIILERYECTANFTEALTAFDEDLASFEDAEEDAEGAVSPGDGETEEGEEASRKRAPMPNEALRQGPVPTPKVMEAWKAQKEHVDKAQAEVNVRRLEKFETAVAELTERVRQAKKSWQAELAARPVPAAQQTPDESQPQAPDVSQPRAPDGAAKRPEEYFECHD
uniref:Uncharacterized protein n=1 Tax=Alexandrium catenella TaxID=2925 RepID=A0A7S1RY28_ALECA|mmetsp:Transcript_78285/g.207769  ORF Transcript_78285/g.207769 Transcript_78285/m.207769 type:complete len:515 (+) Transcript_78285:98-1642(+)